MDIATTSSCTPLYIAANNGRADAVAVLLGAGADPDVPTSSGGTALHAGECCYVGTSMCVLCAVSIMYLNVSALHPSGTFWLRSLHSMPTHPLAPLPPSPPLASPRLCAAALNGHVAAVELLVRAGCEIDAQSQNGATALHNAASGEDPLPPAVAPR